MTLDPSISRLIIKDKQGHQILYTFPLEDQELAFEKMIELESMGLEVELISPGLSQTLALALGHDEETSQKYQEDLQLEFEQHGDSCCVSSDVVSKKDLA